MTLQDLLWMVPTLIVLAALGDAGIKFGISLYCAHLDKEENEDQS